MKSTDPSVCQYSDHSPGAGISVMFWGCITINGVGTLTKVEGNFDSSVYIHVLDNQLEASYFKEFCGKNLDSTRRQLPPT